MPDSEQQQETQPQGVLITYAEGPSREALELTARKILSSSAIRRRIRKALAMPLTNQHRPYLPMAKARGFAGGF